MMDSRPLLVLTVCLLVLSAAGCMTTQTETQQPNKNQTSTIIQTTSTIIPKTTTTIKAASCSDGILNQGEKEVDCGGPCPPCATRIQNLPKFRVRDRWVYREVTRKGDGRPYNTTIDLEYVGQELDEEDNQTYDLFKENTGGIRDPGSGVDSLYVRRYQKTQNDRIILRKEAYTQRVSLPYSSLNYNPPKTRYKFPLEVGAQWQDSMEVRDATYLGATKYALTVNYTIRVIGEEDTITPAGTFKTLVLNGESETYDNAGKLLYTDYEKWYYSPEAKTHVKYTLNRELTNGQAAQKIRLEHGVMLDIYRTNATRELLEYKVA